MRRHPTAPVNVARISVATSGTDFTAPDADFAALIRAAGFCPGRSHLSRGSCRSWDSVWSAPGAQSGHPKHCFMTSDMRAHVRCGGEPGLLPTQAPAATHQAKSSEIRGHIERRLGDASSLAMASNMVAFLA
jgi:hypothetical protein